MLTRRQSLLAATATALAGLAGADPAHAADKTIKIGIDLSLTGADFARRRSRQERHHHGVRRRQPGQRHSRLQV